MKKLSVTVYSNRLYVPYENFQKVIAYNLKHGVELTFDFVRVDVSGYISKFQKTNMGREQYYLTGTEYLVTNTKTDISILCIDGLEWKSPWYSRYPYKPSLPSSSQQYAMGKPLINLLYTKEDDATGMIWLTICHELMHAYVLLSNLKMIRTNDVMDSYWKNDIKQYEDEDSNFSQQWKLLQPWLSGTSLEGAVSPTTSTSLSKWGLVPELEKKAQQFLIETKKAGFDLKITQGFRDPAYQDKLYSYGRTDKTRGIVTNATGKTSLHCRGRAFDFAYSGKTPYPKNGKWEEIGKIGEACGMKWGGRFKSFKDNLHLEI